MKQSRKRVVKEDIPEDAFEGLVDSWENHPYYSLPKRTGRGK